MYLRSGRVYQANNKVKKVDNKKCQEIEIENSLNMTLRSGRICQNRHQPQPQPLCNFRPSPTSNTQTFIVSLEKEYKKMPKSKPKTEQNYFKKQNIHNKNFIDFANIFIEKSIYLFSNIISSSDYIKYSEKLDFSNHLCIHIWNHDQHFNHLIRLLYEVKNPNFDEIDMMLYVCRILQKYGLNEKLTAFILKSPRKFIVTYVNNSESSPSHLNYLNRKGLSHIKYYLLKFVDKSKIVTWKERGHKCVEDILL